MTIIEGETGWIIVDPLTARETAEAALAFALEHLEQRPRASHPLRRLLHQLAPPRVRRPWRDAIPTHPVNTRRH